MLARAGALLPDAHPVGSGGNLQPSVPIKSMIAAFVPHESSMAIGSGSAWTTSGATWLAWTKKARELACAGVLLVARRNSSDAGNRMYI